MDKTRQKTKRNKPIKNVDKEKSPLLITDVKAIKENLKIKEILRTVKMNSSMRIKAPRGSKVMQNKDFIDNEDFEEIANTEDECSSEPPSATNPNVITEPPQDSTHETTGGICIHYNVTDVDGATSDSSNNDIIAEDFKPNIEATIIHKSNSFSESSKIMSQNEDEIKTNSSSTLLVPNDYAQVKSRDRKLSLDQTMLTRREGLSQSELDLHSIGKSPLERKSSFFRKKMDSFFKNTTEIFKRQSLGSKSPSVNRRGSISVSLQSLNEKATCNGNSSPQPFQRNQEVQGSVSSLQSSLTTGHSNSSFSISQGDRLAPDTEDDSLAGSQSALTGSQILGDNMSNSLNEIYIQESLMNSRAISMSSGLDSAHGKGRRKTSRANRVTWLASEGLINYFRRQDEKYKDMQVSYSYQDFSAIPENNLHGSTLDSKGRRLSYQRAVSGEDPVNPVRHQDTLRRKHQIPENHVTNYDIVDVLAELPAPSIKYLRDMPIPSMSSEAYEYLVWTERPRNLKEYFDSELLSAFEESRQSVIRELILTEANYIRQLLTIADQVFIATARTLKERGYFQDIDTRALFINFPEIIIASIRFWEIILYPMIKDAVERETPFDSDLMYPGFRKFPDLFQPYEKFVNNQKNALNYLRRLSLYNTDFTIYINWCHKQYVCNRLRLSDILVMPMQRLTKYSLIITRIISYTESNQKRAVLMKMVTLFKNYVQHINRSIRQKEELEIIDNLNKIIEPYEVDFKDDEMDRIFRSFATLNLRAIMPLCNAHHNRSLVCEGDIRYKDNLKEVDARIFLFTDMMLICKKLPKKILYEFRLIRPKYMLDRLVVHRKKTKCNDLLSITYAVLDEFNSSVNCFVISETTKESDKQISLKAWDQKYREAKLSYEYSVRTSKNANTTVADFDSPLEGTDTMSSEDSAADRDARERVATMLHKKNNVTECDNFMAIDSIDGISSDGNRTSRISRLSSFQILTNAAPYDEPLAGPSTSVQTQNPDDVVNEGCDSKTVVAPTSQPTLPMVVLQHPSPQRSPSPQRHLSPLRSPSPRRSPSPLRSPSPDRYTIPLWTASASTINNYSTSHSSLSSQPRRGVLATIHSLPDLTLPLNFPSFKLQSQRSTQCPFEKLYEFHRVQMWKNRMLVPVRNEFFKTIDDGYICQPPSPESAALDTHQILLRIINTPPTLSNTVMSQALAETIPSADQLVLDEPRSIAAVEGTIRHEDDSSSSSEQQNCE